MAKDFAYMDKLKDTISSTYDCKDVGVSITNGNHVSVTFTNSVYNGLDEHDKRSMAIEVGKLVNAFSETNNRFTSGRLGFIKRMGGFMCNATQNQYYDMCMDSVSMVESWGAIFDSTATKADSVTMK